MSDYLTSTVFGSRVAHLFTTRSGGVSDGVFAEMNLAAGSGDVRDDFENIIKNHDICARELGFTAHDVCRTYQKHTDNVELVTSKHKGTGLYLPPFDYGVDGLVTTEPGVVLSVRGADCCILLAADEQNGVVGALHSGWRGTVKNAVHSLVSKMCGVGAQAKNIAVSLGPCIKGCCYEVGEDVYEQFAAAGYETGFVPEAGKPGKYMLDMTEVIKYQLETEGILPEKTDILPYCTCCDEKFFSHRRMGVNRGTGGGFIALKN